MAAPSAPRPVVMAGAEPFARPGDGPDGRTGVLLVWAPGVIGLSSDLGLVLGVAGVAAGVAMLVSRMRDRPVDDGDDGAVV